MKTTKELANEIVNVLEYNHDLSHEEKVLAVEVRLNQLGQDVEGECVKAQELSKVNAIPVSDYSSILPPDVFAKSADRLN